MKEKAIQDNIKSSWYVLAPRLWRWNTKFLGSYSQWQCPACQAVLLCPVEADKGVLAMGFISLKRWDPKRTPWKRWVLMLRVSLSCLRTESCGSSVIQQTVGNQAPFSVKPAMWKQNKKNLLESSFIFVPKPYWYLQLIPSEEPGLTDAK